MATKKSAPTIRLRRLAGQLRRLRDGTGLRREDVEERTGINATTLYRIETARTRPQYRTLAALLKLYVVPSDEQERLKSLYKQSANQGWIQPWHEDLREEYTAYISFEAGAYGVRNYSGQFVPGLLQTEDYARAVIRGVLHEATDEQVEDRVRTRIERQALLSNEKPLKLWVIIDEAALRRKVGGRHVMRTQLKHLVEAAKVPHVTIQVIPFSSGAHPGMPGEFIVMDFEDPLDTDLIHVDGQAGEIFLESDVDIKHFRAEFDHLVAVAKSPDDSVALITEIAAG
ncbi:transcriptional regulator with XRE-family HTH domain [Saccharothrix ecbatanensis]|uniref:Transcriptional regulator with XRE-family HTH domain n=1 Tax=Saccharothrix ecbatanensis TaxID=1105145 RepID=A0A7W9HUH6_9PSEU|nr:helix-turn-helix transcriptional regulator [Saccharothrix ecbatanensis]MBB5808732.1 transcriptional regulator with XRE-family HTH domain [Saccharothrix ecbatanensis]